MRRSSIPLGLLLLFSCCAPLASGCGSDDGGAHTPAGDLESRLLSDTGVRWLVDRDALGAPLILTAPSAGRSPRSR